MASGLANILRSTEAINILFFHFFIIVRQSDRFEYLWDQNPYILKSNIISIDQLDLRFRLPLSPLLFKTKPSLWWDSVTIGIIGGWFPEEGCIFQRKFFQVFEIFVRYFRNYKYIVHNSYKRVATLTDKYEITWHPLLSSLPHLALPQVVWDIWPIFFIKCLLRLV